VILTIASSDRPSHAVHGMQKSQTSRGFQCTFGDLAAEQQCRLCTTAGGTAWLVLAAFLPLAALLTLGYGVILLALLQTLQVIDLPALNVSAGFAGLPSTSCWGSGSCWVGRSGS
jgi:hypothetical protein